MTICTSDSHQWGQWQWNLPGFQAVGDPPVLINPALTASPYGYWDQQPDWRRRCPRCGTVQVAHADDSAGPSDRPR